METVEPQKDFKILFNTPRQPKDYASILTPEAVAFVAELVRLFRPRVEDILHNRQARKEKYQAGLKPDFLPETKSIREGSWKVAPLPEAILDRRVEITGPVDRKMIINALNSGAKVFMADFEDANSPTLSNCFDGQVNLLDAAHRTISLESGGKKYSLNAQPAVLFVRPRGFHLTEKHIMVDGAYVPGCLVDFGFYFFHNAKQLLSIGHGPYFYLPKMEHHTEARVWKEIFVFAESKLGLPLGSIKATCLIETLPAAFQLNEILYELRDHSAGLNCGRWDYIFSYIKTLQNDPEAILPDRALVTMTQPFMHNYSKLVIQTCHKRGVHAMGGMAAQIPVKNDEEKNRIAFDKVRADKLREANDGHDGTWVAHPALVPVALEVFNSVMKTQNQIDSGKQSDFTVVASDLLTAPKGPKTEESFRHNIRVAIQYLEAWLRGSGAVPIYNLMEDAATAEISRTQIWQWIKFGITLDSADGNMGKKATQELLKVWVEEEMKIIALEVGAERMSSGKFSDAKSLFLSVAGNDDLFDFLTLPAYEYLHPST